MFIVNNLYIFIFAKNRIYLGQETIWISIKCKFENVLVLHVKIKAI
jgi:hypothetical protein